ncbi:hypothetical protein CJO91_11410 [Ralstonia solanacearum]|nr:hypothetical protein CJO83_08145 [Ralstonia solanacearum]AXW33327.1 hypothetical protein CJO88_08185 [Ralstonia solanacearum]AXW43024.1 hypothetical protein CJO90_08140 [Ralstonia solanacearum]AXW48243.1 hypothetical protein CJO91_11410 [Ralstonia solanacearum]AXW66347.1 hypothetical protein CJO95_08145 [Ralstonia solanacearum]
MGTCAAPAAQRVRATTTLKEIRMSNTISAHVVESQNAVEHRTSVPHCALTKLRHDVAMLEAKHDAAGRWDMTRLLWEKAVTRMTDDQRQAELDTLCKMWEGAKAIEREVNAWLPEHWDALYGMLYPLYVWWSREDEARFDAWEDEAPQGQQEGHDPASAPWAYSLRERIYDVRNEARERYRKEYPRHPALGALEGWKHPVSVLRLSADLVTARSELRALEEAVDLEA